MDSCADKSIIGCIVGKRGVGKTSQLLTLPEATTLFYNFEAVSLSVKKKWRGATRKPRTWQECRDIAAILGGANPKRKSDQQYSQTHYTKACERIDKSMFDKYDTIFIDGITAIVKMCFQWCRLRSKDKFGKCDTGDTYKLLAQEMSAWLQQLRLNCKKHIWLTALLDDKPNEFVRRVPSIQLKGNKVALELQDTLDVIVTMAYVRDAYNKPCPVFICDPVNEWSYPAKDKSERLSLIEQPHLWKLMQKILSQTITYETTAADKSCLASVGG